jgi:rubrerythrin
MTDTKTIHIIDSWDLTSIGIVVELKHQFNGLQSGLIIKSQSTGNEWRIKKRILYSHTNGKQKMFSNETTTQSFLSFDSIEKQISSAKNILDKEESNIFQYQLQPIGHKLKPIKGDTLVEMVIHKFACPCCGYKTFKHEPDGSYNICNVCFWEDDSIQLADPDYEGGANRVSLRQAQKNFQKFGACEENMVNNVQPPSNDEARDKNWKWIE